MTTRRQGRGAGGPAALGLLPLLALVTGLLLVGAAVLGQVPDPPSPAVSTPDDSAAASAGDPDAEAAGEAAAVAPPATTAAPGASGPTAAAGTAGPTSSPGAPGSPARPGRPQEPTTVPPLPPAEPVAVRAPAIDVQSPLHPLGLAADGTLEVPTGALVDQAAWYSGSPTPGETGPSVIEGHVTGPGGRPSVFFELAALAPGDRVEVDRADGRTAVFEVYRVDSYAKDAFPTVAVYGPTSGPELRLITCGGEFDEATGHHVDNTVVFARAVDDQA